MRNLIISRIKVDGWLDYLWRREGGREDDRGDYAKWLETLDDDDLLAAYDRVREAERGLD